MQFEDNRTFVWLMVGACLGAVSVFVFVVATGDSDEPLISSWVGALVPTIGAILFGTIGPMIGRRKAGVIEETTVTTAVARPVARGM
jgi:hypothetical protein